MSWASHNPELWDEICLRGILAKMVMFRRLGQRTEEADREALSEVRDTEDTYGVWLALMEWAHEESMAAETDHFADLIDATKEA